ncbi:hypothetical protein BHM03_00039073, partial [Ensete ventricosum]
FAGSGPCALARPPRGLLSTEWELVQMSGDSELGLEGQLLEWWSPGEEGVIQFGSVANSCKEVRSRAFIVGAVDHSYLITLLPLWLTIPPYPPNMLVVLAMRRAFAVGDCRPYLCQVDCTSTGAPRISGWLPASGRPRRRANCPRVANFTRDAAGKFIRPEGGDGGDYEVVVPSTVATSMTSSFMEYEMGVMVTALAHVVAGGRGTVAATDMSASTSTMFPTSSPSSGGEQGGQKRGSDDFKLEEVAKLRRTVGEFGESSSTPAGDSIAVLGVSGGSLSSSSSSLLHGSFSQLNSNLRIYCVSNFHICSLCSNGTNCISSSCCRNRSGYPFDHLRNRASRSENKIQRGAATPVGQMGGGDKRPSQGRPRLARHLQHRRGGRPGLRRGRPPLPRKQSQAQLPGQGTTPARAAGRSVRPGTRPRRSRGAAGVPPVRRSPSHSRRRERLLGLLEAAARRRGVPEDASRFSLGSHDVFYGFCCCLGLLPFIAFFIYFIPVCSSPSSIFSSVLFSRNVATDRLLPTSTMEGI